MSDLDAMISAGPWVASDHPSDGLPPWPIGKGEPMFWFDTHDDAQRAVGLLNTLERERDAARVVAEEWEGRSLEETARCRRIVQAVHQALDSAGVPRRGAVEPERGGPDSRGTYTWRIEWLAATVKELRAALAAAG